MGAVGRPDSRRAAVLLAREGELAMGIHCGDVLLLFVRSGCLRTHLWRRSFCLQEVHIPSSPHNIRGIKPRALS